MSSIFEELVQNENDFTQLLRNLLVRNASLVAATLRQMSLPELSEQDPFGLVLTTQRFFTYDTGRQIPDLLIEGKDFRCVVEAKIDPALRLSEQQRNGYRGCFNGKVGYLCFLTPKNWRYSYQVAEVRALVSPDIKVSHVTWEDLVNTLINAVEDINDNVLSEALEFLNRRFKTVKMSEEERLALKDWSGHSFSAIRKLQSVVDQARGLFEVRMPTLKTERETSAEEYGSYLKDDSKYVLWIGMWNVSKSPLSLGFRNRHNDWRVPGIVPDTFKEERRFLLRPLSVACWQNPEAIYEEVNATLCELGS